MKVINKSLLCIFIVSILFFTTLPATATYWTKKDNTISIGAVTKNPVRDYESFKIFSEYLASSMTDLGILCGRAVLVPTMKEALKLVRDGIIDIIAETPYSGYTLIKKAGMTPILVGLRDEEREYCCILVVKKDSDIRYLSDLVNKKILFKDSNSTVTYIVPRLYLESKGLKLFLVPFIMYPLQVIPEGYTAYDFSCSQKNSIQAVMDGTADACAIRSTLWEKNYKIPKSIKRQLRILIKTAPVPRSFILSSSVLSEDIKERITATLTQSSDIPEIYRTRQYERLTSKDMEYLQDLESLLY